MELNHGFRALISIAGTDITDPSVYEGNTATIVDSARNTEGQMVGAVIRENVGKVTATWNFISRSDWANLLALFDSSRGGSFTNEVTFFCQDTGDWETRTMYVSDRTASVFLRDKNGAIRGYTNARMALIEV